MAQFKAARAPLRNPALLTLAEAAAVFSRAPRTMRRWIENGTLPAYKVAGQLLVKVADIEALIERSRVPNR